MTATKRLYQSSGWTKMTMRRALRTIRYVNDELLRASEAMIRTARAPQPRPQTSAPASDTKAPAEKLTVPDRPSAETVAATDGTGAAA